MAPHDEAPAPATGGTTYPGDDAGIRAMYLDLTGTDAFRRARYCYVPTLVGPDLDPGGRQGLDNGYDPATGMRTLVQGTAVSQVVPLDEFLRAGNEQIYDPAPSIVPLVTALVYDISDHNTLGAKTFDLPTVYSRDRVDGTDYVNRLHQTVVFPDGPGYDERDTTPLELTSVATVVAPDHTFATFHFEDSTVVTTSNVEPIVRKGVTTFSYEGTAPGQVFAHQRFIGFYRENDWPASHGLPIWDYGAGNAEFRAGTTDPSGVEAVFDATHSVLNGGSLANVVAKLRAAEDVHTRDVLELLLRRATTGRSERGVGLEVTAATLDFAATPAGAHGPIIDRLDVPVVAAITTAPVRRGWNFSSSTTTCSSSATASSSGPRGPCGSSVTAPTLPTATDPAPVTKQVGLTAFVPNEALAGTGISHLALDTAFPRQPFDPEAAAKAIAGTTVNLMERHDVEPPSAPVHVSLAKLDFDFRPGVSYVLTATGKELAVRGADGSAATLTASIAGTGRITHVGAMVFGSGHDTVRLFPKLALTLPALPADTGGIRHGEPYSVRVTYGRTTSEVEVFDAAKAVVASGIEVPSPKPAGKFSPRAGDHYFGSFVGGARELTVWSVPVFLMLGPGDVGDGQPGGSSTLDAVVSGVPGYRLQVTDNSLFVFSTVDLGTSGDGDGAGTFLAAAVINSSPDDRSPAAFTPSPLLLGTVQPVRMGAARKWVFVPADDSVLIGDTRYTLSVIEMEALDFDPTARAYPPLAWPDTRFWQFANKHNPYRAVRYTGDTQAERLEAGAEGRRTHREAHRGAGRADAPVPRHRPEAPEDLADPRLPVRFSHADDRPHSPRIAHGRGAGAARVRPARRDSVPRPAGSHRRRCRCPTSSRCPTRSPTRSSRRRRPGSRPTQPPPRRRRARSSASPSPT